MNIPPLPARLLWADLSGITAPKIGWRELVESKSRNNTFFASLYRWRRCPRVYILDFPDLAEQGQTLNRIAAFTEKKGVRGRILPDRELNAYIRGEGLTPSTFFYGHDYRFEDLALFFNTAGPGVLTQREIEFRNLLLLTGILYKTKADKKSKNRPEYRPGAGALLSVTRGVKPSFRKYLVKHELRHGLYFLNRKYRAKVDAFWRREVSSFWRRLFVKQMSRWGYASDYGYLMRNEFQAYLLETDYTLEDAFEANVLLSERKKGEAAYGKEKLILKRRREIVKMRNKLRSRLKRYNFEGSAESAKNGDLCPET